MYADQRETQLIRRWVPKSQSPGDDMIRRSSLENAVVRLRSGPGRRDAELPEGRKVQVPEIHKGLDYSPRSPRSELGGEYQGTAQRTEPNQPQSPMTSMRKTRNPLGAHVGKSRRDRPHQSSEIQGRGDGSKDVPELSPPGAQNLEVEQALMCPDWLPLPDVQPSAQPNEDCPRAQAVEELLNSGRG